MVFKCDTMDDLTKGMEGYADAHTDSAAGTHGGFFCGRRYGLGKHDMFGDSIEAQIRAQMQKAPANAVMYVGCLLQQAWRD